MVGDTPRAPRASSRQRPELYQYKRHPVVEYNCYLCCKLPVSHSHELCAVVWRQTLMAHRSPPFRWSMTVARVVIANFLAALLTLRCVCFKVRLCKRHRRRKSVMSQRHYAKCVALHSKLHNAHTHANSALGNTHSNEREPCSGLSNR